MNNFFTDMSTTIFLVLLIFLFVLIYIKLKHRFWYWRRLGVPYEKPTIIFGNMISVIVRQKSLNQLFIEWYKKYATSRYCGIYIFSQPILLVMDLDLIKQICIKDFDKFTDRMSFIPKYADPFWGNGISEKHGDSWREMRAILSPAFTNSKMKTMFSLMMECAQEFITYLETQNSDVILIDMKEALTKFTNDVTASCMFSFKCNSYKQPNNVFYLTGKEAFNFKGIKAFKLFGEVFSVRLMKAFRVTMFSKSVENFFRRIVKEAIHHRRDSYSLRPDMIQLLSKVQRIRLDECPEEENKHKLNPKNNKGIITDGDIASQVAVFFFGGYDTVSNLLSNIVHALALNPEVQNKLIEEIDIILTHCDGKITYQALKDLKYLDMVVSECLRLWPSVTFFTRKCTQPYTIEPERPGEKPLQLQVGQNVMIPVFAIHRDPNYFPEPDEFNPERFNDEIKNKTNQLPYMPFGVGPRYCIGYRYALVAVKLLIIVLLSRFAITPVKATSPSHVLDKATIAPVNENGYWLGLKKRCKLELTTSK